MRNFVEKNALITGGASGIGLATAKELIRCGANVTIFDLNGETLESAVKDLETFAGEVNADVRCAGETGDVTDFEAIKKVAEDMEAKGSPVDLLITCAGIAHPTALAELDIDIIKKTVDIDLLGTLYTCRAVLPGMIKRGAGGHIALVSSLAGILGVYGYSAYGAAKFGVRGLGEVLRQELKPYGIEVTVLFPPDTDTPQFEYENRYKPEATKAISGTIKPVSAEYVARCLVKGIRKNRFQVIPTFTGKLTSSVSKLLGPILRWYLVVVVKKVVKGRGAGGAAHPAN